MDLGRWITGSGLCLSGGHSCQPARPKVGTSVIICGSKVGTFPYRVNTFPYMVIIASVHWRDNNRNPQIFGGTALKKVGLSL